MPPSARSRPPSARIQFLFLRLFTTAQQPLPSFVSFLGFLLPLVAIALAFDAINGEYSRRTHEPHPAAADLPRRASHRQVPGRAAGLAICLLTLWLLMTGLGILCSGCRRAARRCCAALPSCSPRFAYGGVWLAVALLFSTDRSARRRRRRWRRSPLWLLFTVFWPMLAPLIAGAVAPIDPLDPMTAVHNRPSQQAISRISPNTLYGEMTLALLDPSTRTLGLLFT